MIAHLEGLLFEKSTQSAIINTGGVGYEVFVPLSTFYCLPEKNEKVHLYIFTHVREDSLLLFGFNTLLEKEIFLMLISVSGIGPKLAINILSGIGPKELLEAIASGDAVLLQSIPGVGKKTSERIALELKERAAKVCSKENYLPADVHELKDSGMVDDALSALQNLGYPKNTAKRAVKEVLSKAEKEITLEELIKETLKAMA